MENISNKEFFSATKQVYSVIKHHRQELITILNKKYNLIGNTKITPDHFLKLWDNFPLVKNENDKNICSQYWAVLCGQDVSLSLEAFENVLKVLKKLWDMPLERAELKFRGITDITSFLKLPYHPFILKKTIGNNTLTTYQEQLQHPLWQKKRLEIMQRDNFCCQNCNDTQTTLNVHHKKYLQGKPPWEYPNEDLITLCEICHSIIELNKKK